MELLRVVDNNGNDTNEILEREELHNRGKLHNEVTIYIINNKKEVLLQRRSKNRRFCPNMLGVIAGHVSYNETPLVCAGREIKEEVGLKVSKIFFNASKYYEKSNSLICNFIVSVEDENFKLNPEVDFAKWYFLDEAKEAILKNGLAEAFFLMSLEKIKQKNSPLFV